MPHHLRVVPREAPPAFNAQTAELEVSVVMPCLNEADTLGSCIEKAQRAIRAIASSVR